jgi:hypothetical protein
MDVWRSVIFWRVHFGGVVWDRGGNCAARSLLRRSGGQPGRGFDRSREPCLDAARRTTGLSVGKRADAGTAENAGWTVRRYSDVWIARGGLAGGCGQRSLTRCGWIVLVGTLAEYDGIDPKGQFPPTSARGRVVADADQNQSFGRSCRCRTGARPSARHTHTRRPIQRGLFRCNRHLARPRSCLTGAHRITWPPG